MLLTWAIIFAVVGLIALLLGARGVASLTFGVAKILFVIFLVIALVLILIRVLG